MPPGVPSGLGCGDDLPNASYTTPPPTGPSIPLIHLSQPVEQITPHRAISTGPNLPKTKAFFVLRRNWSTTGDRIKSGRNEVSFWSILCDWIDDSTTRLQAVQIRSKWGRSSLKLVHSCDRIDSTVCFATNIRSGHVPLRTCLFSAIGKLLDANLSPSESRRKTAQHPLVQIKYWHCLTHRSVYTANLPLVVSVIGDFFYNNFSRSIRINPVARAHNRIIRQCKERLLRNAT
jgi:hypothetical protein